MILFKEAAATAKYLEQLKQKGLSIGFAPTMGALHPGHISLIKKSKLTCDITVTSIFVNPTQFNDPADFEKYPVTLESDILLLEEAGCDILFLPSLAEIYPNGTKNTYRYDLGEIEFLLEGKFRPGHFQGVCRIVHRLLNIVQPLYLFLGQKDYQQLLVVKRLVQLVDSPVHIMAVPTAREASGLAMSSRNVRLNEQQKQEATAISKLLRYIQDNYAATPFSVLKKYAADFLFQSGFNKIDYVSIADAETLREVSSKSESKHLIALIAAFTGEVRLIDNAVLQD